MPTLLTVITKSLTPVANLELKNKLIGLGPGLPFASSLTLLDSKKIVGGPMNAKAFRSLSLAVTILAFGFSVRAQQRTSHIQSGTAVNYFARILSSNQLRAHSQNGMLVIQPSTGDISVYKRKRNTSSSIQMAAAQYCLDSTTLGQLDQILKDGASCSGGSSCFSYFTELSTLINKIKSQLSQYQCSGSPVVAPVAPPVATPAPPAPVAPPVATPAPAPVVAPVVAPVAPPAPAPVVAPVAPPAPPAPVVAPVAPPAPPAPIVAPVVTPAPAPTNATYTYISQNILTPKCVSCHGNAGGYNFSSYANTMKSVTANNASSSPLYKAVANGSMPTSGSLSQSDIQLIQAWIQAGAPNN